MKLKERSWTSILISPSFQLKFLSYFVGLFFLTTISLYSTTYLFFWGLKNKGLKVGIPEGHVYYQFLQNQKHDLDSLFIGLAIFNFILLIGVGFIISHRIAGPIHQIKLYLQDTNQNKPPIKFRKSDFFHELGPMLNKTEDQK